MQIKYLNVQYPLLVASVSNVDGSSLQDQGYQFLFCGKSQVELVIDVSRCNIAKSLQAVQDSVVISVVCVDLLLNNFSIYLLNLVML